MPAGMTAPAFHDRSQNGFDAPVPGLAGCPAVDPLLSDLIRHLAPGHPGTGFRNVATLIQADRAELLRAGLPGSAHQTLALFRRVALALSRERLADRPVIGDEAAVLAHARTWLAGRRREAVLVLFLDRRNGLVADEIVAEGDLTGVRLSPREVLRRALAHDATALILAHNHPSGDSTPSKGDIETTRALADAATALDITLHDHLVLGRGAPFSFRRAGLL